MSSPKRRNRGVRRHQLGTTEEDVFAGRMKRLLIIALGGIVLMLAPGILLMSFLRPIDDYAEIVIGAGILGFVTFTLAGSIRANAKCVKCGRIFCGDSEDPASNNSMNTFSQSCKYCGYELRSRAI